MPSPFKMSFTLLTALCFAGSAFADPPSEKTETEVLVEKIEDKLSDHKVEIAKSTARLKRKLDKGQAKSNGEMSDEIDVFMDVMEDAFAEDGLFRDMAAMFGDFAKDIDIESNDDATTLIFDGAKIGQVRRSKSRNSEDQFSISGLGKNLTIDRETIVKDGKSKTRIIIDMDGDNELDITLPDLAPDEKPTE